MLTAIDHVTIGVPDLPKAMDALARIGFDVHHGGVHAGEGTHNVAFLESDYLELLGVRDADEYRRAAAPPGSPLAGLPEFLARGGGFRAVVVQSDDLDADVAGMRARGVDVGDPADGRRRTPAGQELTWRMAVLGPRHSPPVLFNPAPDAAAGAAPAGPPRRRPTGRCVSTVSTSPLRTSRPPPRRTAACSGSRRPPSSAAP